MKETPEKSLLFKSDWIYSSLSLQYLTKECLKGHTFIHRAAVYKQGLPRSLSG